MAIIYSCQFQYSASEWSLSRDGNPNRQPKKEARSEVFSEHASVVNCNCNNK